jgi:hypothetical protein
VYEPILGKQQSVKVLKIADTLSDVLQVTIGGVICMQVKVFSI